MKVLIADDHGLYRAGLSLLFKDQLGIGEVLEVGSLDEAIDLLARHEDIKLALFDLSMPGMAGPESLAAVKSTYPDTLVGVISGSEDRDNVLKCISTGLSGYIPKSLSDDTIAKALEMMLAGSVFVPSFMLASAPPPKPAADLAFDASSAVGPDAPPARCADLYRSRAVEQGNRAPPRHRGRYGENPSCRAFCPFRRT